MIFDVIFNCLLFVYTSAFASQFNQKFLKISKKSEFFEKYVILYYFVFWWIDFSFIFDFFFIYKKMSHLLTIIGILRDITWYPTHDFDFYNKLLGSLDAVFYGQAALLYKIWAPNFLNADLHVILKLRNIEIGEHSSSSIIEKKLECSPISKFLSVRMIWSKPFKKISLGSNFHKSAVGSKNSIFVNRNSN